MKKWSCGQIIRDNTAQRCPAPPTSGNVSTLSSISMLEVVQPGNQFSPAFPHSLEPNLETPFYKTISQREKIHGWSFSASGWVRGQPPGFPLSGAISVKSQHVLLGVNTAGDQGLLLPPESQTSHPIPLCPEASTQDPPTFSFLCFWHKSEAKSLASQMP